MSTRADLNAGLTTSRSYVLCAAAGFDFADFVTSGTSIPFCTLPIDARVLGGYVAITTVFDAATSDTIIVGDAADDNEYMSGLDAQVAATTEFSLSNLFDAAGANTPAIVAASDNIAITNTWVGAKAAAGIGDLAIFYVDVTKADENFE